MFKILDKSDRLKRKASWLDIYLMKIIFGPTVLWLFSEEMLETSLQSVGDIKYESLSAGGKKSKNCFFLYLTEDRYPVQ